MEDLIFYADKIMVMGNYKNLHVFNFVILLKSRQSRKFDARKIYMFYTSSAFVQYLITAVHCSNVGLANVFQRTTELLLDIRVKL